MKKIEINPSETKDAYFHINSKGHLTFKIESEDGNNSLKAWWIKGPFGTVEQIGFISGVGYTEIKGTLWGKLRITNAQSRTIILLSENTEPNFNFPPIEF